MVETLGPKLQPEFASETLEARGVEEAGYTFQLWTESSALS